MSRDRRDKKGGHASTRIARAAERRRRKLRNSYADDSWPQPELMDRTPVEHKIDYCFQCGAVSVVCGRCGTWTCTGTEECEHCPSAYKMAAEREKKAS